MFHMSLIQKKTRTRVLQILEIQNFGLKKTKCNKNFRKCSWDTKLSKSKYQKFNSFMKYGTKKNCGSILKLKKIKHLKNT